MINFEDKIKELEAKINVVSPIEQGLQRTSEWFEQRRGRFTGSKIKDLMSSNRSVSKKNWSDPTKILGLGDGALTYIYEKAMERKEGYVIRTASTASMRYGSENEDVVKLMFEQKNKVEVQEIGFIQHPNFDFLGASPDGKITASDDKNYAVEIKCPTSWSNYMKRMEVEFDLKHIDFWQIQTEMMCMGVDECVCIVAYPPENIFEPEIRGFDYNVVQAIPEIQNAILERAKLGNLIIETFEANYWKDFYKSVGIGVTNF